MEIEGPKIRQVLFTLDKDLSYKFDVNQTTTIHGLKRMLSVAASLPKQGFSVFHNDIEYTDYDDSSLAELFADLQLVEFKISVLQLPHSGSDDSKIKLKLGEYCPNHIYKYLYFYCYDCKKSICSVCVQSTAQKSHKVIEKYDYLQNSKHLVDLVFKDIHKFLPDSKFNKSSDADELKRRIKDVYFKNLHEMLTSIELKLHDLIDNFKTASESTFQNIQHNIDMIKPYCTMGLDELKQELQIENILMNEEIFLAFDKKYNEIANEQIRLARDSGKYEELNLHFNSLAETVDSIYNDTYKFLDAKLNLPVYTELPKKIQKDTVSQITPEEILQKILDEVVKTKKSKKSIGNESISRIDALGNPSNTSVLLNTAQKNLSSEFAPEKILQTPLTSSKQSVVKEDISDGKACDKPILQEYTKNIMAIFPETKEIAVFDDGNNTLERREVEFPQFSGIPNFLKCAATINYKGKLYISGGQQGPESGSTAFLSYEPIQDSLVRLPDMICNRFCHSILSHDNMIYAIGGYKTNTCERYDIQKMTWSKMANMNETERQYPILHVNANCLYAFFGSTIGPYIDSVEKTNLRTLKSRWDIVPFKNPDKIDLKIIWAGIVPCNSNELYFFGGTTKEETRSDTFKFNFSKNTFSVYDAKLEDATYFKETSLLYLGNESYGHFDSESGSHFLRILLG